jgi:hypothetical protein
MLFSLNIGWINPGWPACPLQHPVCPCARRPFFLGWDGRSGWRMLRRVVTDEAEGTRCVCYELYYYWIYILINSNCQVPPPVYLGFQASQAQNWPLSRSLQAPAIISWGLFAGPTKIAPVRRDFWFCAPKRPPLAHTWLQSPQPVNPPLSRNP